MQTTCHYQSPLGDILLVSDEQGVCGLWFEDGRYYADTVEDDAQAGTKRVAKLRHRTSMSSQAVGNAVGKNHLSLFIPCHRVIGAHGNLTGYGGGLERKIALLELEGHLASDFSWPS